MRPWMVAALCLPASAIAADGVVKVPLQEWERMLDTAAASAERPPAPVPVLQVDRSIEGTFRKGVFTGTLLTRIWIPVGGGDLRVPILDATASIASVQLNGKTTSLLPEGGFYTVAIDEPGIHSIRVDFFSGREDDRFARRLQLALPPSGPTRLAVSVPEVDIESSLSQGAVTAERTESGGTRIEGQLDGRSQLDLTWKGRSLQAAVPVKMEVKEYTLFTLHEALVRGVAVLDTTVLEGETDRVAIQLPEAVEVVDVTGDAVLQWQTEPGKVVVLLRYLVSDQAQVKVHFQFPVNLDEPVPLHMPLPEAGVPFEGAIGVQGPAGLQAVVKTTTGAEALNELPTELANLTPNPLLLGFHFDDAPSVTLDVTRQAEVELTSTIVDEMEASTMLMEDGTEITKVQLRVRNNTRQYLATTLPEGAVLTHALIDGRPVRPAVSGTGSDEQLLFPLVQSERFADGAAQLWTVQYGDTLGGIADRFYSDPSQSSFILDNNRDQLSTEYDLTIGQVLKIPGRRGVQESSFVIELAWTRDGGDMGWFGGRNLVLPEVDADVVTATWHVYLPSAVLPLSFSANLTQYSEIRYDHFRRFRYFLRDALNWNTAWAGSGYDAGEGYKNILSRRKSIYQKESSKLIDAQEATSSFPLVGDRYRFKRLLPGREVPHIRVLWMFRSLIPAVRWLGFAAGAALVVKWLGNSAKGSRAAVLLGLVAMLVIAWHVEGVHRRLLWGVDAGLMWTLMRSRIPERWTEWIPPRQALLDQFRISTLVRLFVATVGLYALLGVPLLWSTAALGLLVWRVRRAS